MRYRKMGWADLEVSELGLGALHFGVYCDQKQTDAIVDMALDCGINLIDTAPMYGNGDSEAVIRRAIKGRRDKVILATKVGLRADIGADGYFRCTKVPLREKDIRESLENSLRNLGTDRVDIFQLHFFDHTTPVDETLATLERLVEEGKIRFAGCSNFNEEEFDTTAASWKKNGFTPFASFQNHYNLIERRSEDGLIPRCDDHDIGIVVNRALARGILSGKYRRGEAPPEGSRGQMSQRVNKLLTERVLKVVEEISRVCGELGRTPAEVSVAWLLDNPRVRSVLVGARSPAQLQSSLDAVENQITTEEIEALDQAIAKVDVQDYVMSMPETFLET